MLINWDVTINETLTVSVVSAEVNLQINPWVSGWYGPTLPSKDAYRQSKTGYENRNVDTATLGSMALLYLLLAGTKKHQPS